MIRTGPLRRLVRRRARRAVAGQAARPTPTASTWARCSPACPTCCAPPSGQVELDAAAVHRRPGPAARRTRSRPPASPGRRAGAGRATPPALQQLLDAQRERAGEGQGALHVAGASRRRRHARAGRRRPGRGGLAGRASSVAPVEVTDAIRPGVVSLPHGWGHDLAGTRLGVAADHAGVNSNILTDGAGARPAVGQRRAQRHPRDRARPFAPDRDDPAVGRGATMARVADCPASRTSTRGIRWTSGWRFRRRSPTSPTTGSARPLTPHGGLPAAGLGVRGRAGGRRRGGDGAALPPRPHLRGRDRPDVGGGQAGLAVRAHPPGGPGLPLLRARGRRLPAPGARAVAALAHLPLRRPRPGQRRLRRWSSRICPIARMCDQVDRLPGRRRLPGDRASSPSCTPSGSPTPACSTTRSSSGPATRRTRSTTPRPPRRTGPCSSSASAITCPPSCTASVSGGPRSGRP